MEGSVTIAIGTNHPQVKIPIPPLSAEKPKDIEDTRQKHSTRLSWVDG